METPSALFGRFEQLIITSENISLYGFQLLRLAAPEFPFLFHGLKDLHSYFDIS